MDVSALNTLIVVDDAHALQGVGLDEVVLTFQEYLEEHPKKGERKLRLINLCDTEHYLSKGYYCSLLAEARGHRVLPSVNTINDLRSEQLYLARIKDALRHIASPAGGAIGERRTFYIYLGEASEPAFEPLAKKLFSLFGAPILQVTLGWSSFWHIESISRVALNALSEAQTGQFLEALRRFNAGLWKGARSRKRYRWDMAVLVNPEERMPPSNKGALSRMLKAARRVGIEARVITASDYPRLNEYDALFIRETTAIDHHTYRFSRRAEIEDMVVIDDPTSILRCCNKVFMHDAFTYNAVPSLKTKAVFSCDESVIDTLQEAFDYPMVIKQPEGSFSRGVFKVQTRRELKEKLGELLEHTSLVLVQEYLYTDFDWRIGLFNNRPLYACRYHMARNHWQIYDHAKKGGNSGGFETLPTFEVPRQVLEAAQKAAKVVGNGLYGVDIKQVEKRAYVIEVNDNPSIDHNVEDAYLGDELYMSIMLEMVRRLELRGRE